MGSLSIGSDRADKPWIGDRRFTEPPGRKIAIQESALIRLMPYAYAVPPRASAQLLRTVHLTTFERRRAGGRGRKSQSAPQRARTNIAVRWEGRNGGSWGKVG